jgi:RimJ/RimL family protein N-acetyltransferase
VAKLASLLDKMIVFERFGGGEARLIPLKKETISQVDLQSITEVCSQELVGYWVTHQYASGPDGSYMLQDAEKFVKHADAGWTNATTFVYLIRNADNDIVGAVDVQSPDPVDAPIGYWADTTGEHRGYMTNAVCSLCELAREAGYASLIAYVRPQNKNSVGVLERAGFENKGTAVNPKTLEKMLLFAKNLHKEDR